MKISLADIKPSTKNIIVITGLTRSGKTAICPIISSLKNCEQFFFSTAAENLNTLNFLGKVDFKTSKNLIQRCINEEVQDKINGRNLNTKKNDYTSISSFKNISMYLKRVNASHKPNENHNDYKKNNFPILFHEALLNLKLIEESMFSPKIINISRHPVDLVKSWINKRYAKQHYKLSNNNVITYLHQNKVTPFFCYGIENKIKYQKSEEDMIVNMVFNLNKIFKKNYQKSKKKHNLILIKFDNFVLKPKKYLDLVCKKFSLKKTSHTNKVLLEQKCPRKLNYKERIINKAKISAKLSQENKKIFLKMIDEYENNKVTF